MYIPHRSFYLSEHVKETGKQKRIKKKKIIITTHIHAYKTQDQFFFTPKITNTCSLVAIDRYQESTKEEKKAIAFI